MGVSSRQALHTGVVSPVRRGCRRALVNRSRIRRRLESVARDRDSRVGDSMLPQDWCLSSTGHEQSGVKLGSPLPKATYTQRPIAHSTVRER